MYHWGGDDLYRAITSRNWALRSVWFSDTAIYLALFIIGRSKLTTAKLESAHAASRPL
jgi:hypothetical protein